MNLQLVNLTTHTITVYAGAAPIASWQPSGQFARLGERRHLADTIESNMGALPVVAVGYTDEVLDLPAQVPGTAYLVSRVLAERVARDDLYFPFDEVRGPDGRIIGCRALGRFTREVTDAG